MPSARYVPRPYVPEVYDSPNLVRLSELARASGYTQAERARTQGQQSAQGWARLGDLVVNALQGIQGDKAQKAALAQRIVEKAKDDQLQRDKLDEEINARKGQQQWQRDQFRVGTADAAADVMTPGQSVDPATFGQRFAGTPSEVRFSHDPAREALLPATSMADTGGVPGFATPRTDQQPFEVMAGPSMSADTAARPERYTRKPLFSESLAVENLQRQKDAATAAEARSGAATQATALYRTAMDRRQAARDAEIARHNQVMEKRPVSGGAPSVDNISEAIAGMKDGTIPPQLPGRASKDYTAIMAEAHRQGYDLATAAQDWTATQKHLSTLNGAQQTRLRQAIGTAYDSLDVIDDLAGKWKGGRFPILNKANLALAKNGAYGKDVASIATQLEGQITDVTSELANAYMGGNSPTDHALQLAAKNLNGAWDEKVLKDMTQLARKNLTIRNNSIKNAGAITATSQRESQTPAPVREQWGFDANGTLVKKGGG